jgi:RNA polymerase sigma factor (sigma-70 family)
MQPTNVELLNRLRKPSDEAAREAAAAARKAAEPGCQPTKAARVAAEAARLRWEADWVELYYTYAKPVVDFAEARLRSCKVTTIGANDVLQATMVGLMRLLPTFEYRPEKGKFRNLVLMIAKRTILNEVRRLRRFDALVESLDAEGPNGQPPLADTVADERSLSPAERADLGSQRELLDEARQRAEDDRRQRTLAVYREYVVEGRPAREVAAKYGLKTNNVYQIKNRLKSGYEMEMARLRRERGEVR